MVHDVVADQCRIDSSLKVAREDAAFVARYAVILPQVRNLRPSGLDALLLFQVCICLLEVML